MTLNEKNNIKKAILKAVENGCTEPELLLSKLLNTFEKIDCIGAVQELIFQVNLCVPIVKDE